jgi:hypothetical protein
MLCVFSNSFFITEGMESKHKKWPGTDTEVADGAVWGRGGGRGAREEKSLENNRI